MATWKPRDRVRVQLPDKDGHYGYRGRMEWFPGTVREVDPLDSRPGVTVDLDFPVSGVRDCFATHTELKEHTDGQAR